LDLIWIILDRPRSAIVGMRLVLKFGLDLIYSFGDIAILIFCRFGFIFFWGGAEGGVRGIFPHHRHNPQKALPYVETHRLSHKA